MNNKRQIGQIGEELVSKYYLDKGYEIIDRNYTIPGGEIDIIAKKDFEIVFIEVKVVDGIDDVFGYITQKKIYFLEKCIENYFYKNNYNNNFNSRLDAVFVKNNTIVDIFENITNN